MELNQIIQGDCLEVMDQLITDGIIVDSIITDPPYGTTACKWDSVIPFDEMWLKLKKIVKPNGAVALFGSEPFSSALRMSNIKDYKYDWVWNKTRGSNFASLKFQPFKCHELISIFSKKSHIYNPQLTKSRAYVRPPGEKSIVYGMKHDSIKTENAGFRHPLSIQAFKKDQNALHPTQKPVALMEYLIKTYTLPGEIVLDFTMGSGSTGVAAKKLGRKFIGIELDTDYFEIAKNRINEVWAPGQTEPSNKKPIAEKDQLDIWDALVS